MNDEKKVGEANAGFTPEVLTSKSGRRHLSDESKRRLIESIAATRAETKALQSHRLADLKDAVVAAAVAWAGAVEAFENGRRFNTGSQLVRDAERVDLMPLATAEKTATENLRAAVKNLNETKGA